MRFMLVFLGLFLVACSSTSEMSAGVDQVENDQETQAVRPLVRQYGAYRARAHTIVKPPAPPSSAPVYLQDKSWTVGTGPHTDADPALIVDGGDVDLEGRWTATADNWSGPDLTFFSCTTADGTMSLRYETSFINRYVWKVRGVDIVNDAENPGTRGSPAWRVGDELRWRVWYRPSTEQYGLRSAINGVVDWDVTGSTTGSALAAPSGTVTVLADELIARFVAQVPTATQPEIVVLGDSTIGSWGREITVAHDIYTTDQRWTRPGIGMLAVIGDTAQGQQAKWDVSGPGEAFWHPNPNLHAVIIEIGINNILLGDSEATARTRIQALIDDVHTTRPDVKIILAKMIPIKGYLDANFGGSAAAMFTEWQNLNADVAGSGPANFTSVDARITAHEATLNDGTGALKTLYDIGDHLHENNDGRTIIAGVYKTALQSLGLLP
jgi:hypothetical protein